ncbi:uncharacterized protein EV422DRAFT_493068 [Fimicolochytrium jonesii]|uniref:uncharacterized protein n=1 Tax=Fimicolochytrium jonesii TaxID=1396493 RepID=UPI0022FE0A0D|nr:uncharacterized protein EV422DRAFT_493068 [Fimicolochytrium jonesii]KAI8824022.1 hypothetical protein EV422DRAFT_493068 [Fimicolochytrium jonesii]
MDDLEHHKENIRPVKTGRSAAALSKLYGASGLSSSSQTGGVTNDESGTSPLSASQLESQRLTLADTLTSSIQAGHATFNQYHTYLKFLQQYYPAGHPDFYDVLQESVRVFKHSPEYKNDPRYLWMWTEVANQAKDAVEVFKYLSVNEIGTGLSTFYEAYASLMVEARRWDEAEELYRVGIGKGAVPVERLKRKLEDFMRMPRRGEGREEEGEGEGEGAEGRAQGGYYNENQHLQTARRPALAPLAAGPRSKPSASGISAGPSQPQGNARVKMQVYQDRSENESRRALTSRVLPSASTAGPWAEYGTSSSRRKENVREATKWTGSTLPQSGAGGGRAALAPQPRSRIEVYQDEVRKQCTFRFEVEYLYLGIEAEFLLTASQPSGSDLTVPGVSDNVLREKDIKAAAEPSTSTMLAEIDRPSPPTAPPATEPASRPAQPKPAKTQSSSNGSKPSRPEKMMVKMDLFYDEAGNVWSFEEVRAAHMLRKEEEQPPTPAQIRAAADDSEPKFHQKAKAVASPTINTKAALADVFEMFNQPLQCESQPPSAAGSREEERDDGQGGLYVEEDETISAKVFKRDTNLDIGVSSTKPSSILQVTDPALHSTPYHRRASAGEDDYEQPLADQDQDDAHHSHHPRFQGRLGPLAIMTPITEASHESSRAMTGLSTIGRRPGLMDDGHTVMTMNTFGERTLSSISYEGSGNGSRTKINIANPCNPYTEPVKSQILSRFDTASIPSLHSHPSTSLNLTTTIEKSLKKAERSTSKARGRDSVAATDTLVSLPGAKPLKLVRKLGEGGFGKVYLVETPLDEDDADMSDEDDEDDGDDEKVGRKQVVETSWALKVLSTPNPWEHLLLLTLHARLPLRITSSIIRPHACHVFQGETCMLLANGKHGTLLNCVNVAGKYGYGSGLGGTGGGGIGGAAGGDAGVEEALAAFWAIEILRTLEGVHAAGVVHRDVKVDNFLVRLDDSAAGGKKGDEEWDGVYQPDGARGWAKRGVTLIDWGTGIDVRMFAGEQKFTAAAEICWELRNGVPWTFEPDWYGAAGVIHVLLFGRYMQVVEDASACDTNNSSTHPRRPHIRLAASFKRYWQVDLWKRLFDALLNADYDTLHKSFPHVHTIRAARVGMEEWLARSSTRVGKNLRGLLKRVGTATVEEGRRSGGGRM